MAEFNKDQTEQEKQQDSAFRSLGTLVRRWKDGTFGEIIDDWRWIFSYSKKYKGGQYAPFWHDCREYADGKRGRHG